MPRATRARDRKMKIVGLTNYLIDLQPARTSLFGMLLVSLAASFTTIYLAGLTPNWLLKTTAYALGALFLPGFLTAIFTNSATNALDKTLPFRRSAYLALFCTTIASALFLVGGFAAGFTDQTKLLDLLVFSYALIFIIRVFILAIATQLTVNQSIAIGAIQPLLGWASIYALSIIAPTLLPSFTLAALTVKILVSLAVLSAGLLLFMVLMEAPMKRGFGLNTFKLANAFFSNWFDESTSIEDILQSIGEKTQTLLGLIAFKTKKNVKALIIVPYLHPGPFGKVGGAKLTKILAEYVEPKLNTTVIIPHGTVTHDMNPTTTATLYDVARSVVKHANTLSYSANATPATRAKISDTQVISQKLGKSIFLASTFAPKPTEDVDLSIGIAVMNNLKRGFSEAIYCDAHNAHMKGDHTVYSANPEMFNLLNCTKKAGEQTRKLATGKPRMGLAVDKFEGYNEKDGIGPLGLRAIALEVNGQKNCYLVFDANNLKSGLREKIIPHVKKLGFNEIEIMTSDTHYVNTIQGVENPLGQRISLAVLTKKSVNAARKALEDLEPVSIGTKMTKINGIEIMGSQRSLELVTTVNSMVAIMKIITPIILLSSFSISLWSILQIPW